MWSKEDKYSVPRSMTVDSPRQQIKQKPVRVPKASEKVKQELNQ